MNSLAAFAFFWAATACAQIPLDCTPPRAERWVPTVFLKKEVSSEAAGPAPIALAIDAAGQPWGTRVAADGTPLPALPADHPALWIPGRNHEADVPGAFWHAPPGAFYFELDAAAFSPPEPLFLIPRIPAGKFALVARVIEKGTLRVDFTLDEDGRLSDIECWDRRLTAFARDFFEAMLPAEGPAFVPARDRLTGKPVATSGQLRWDLSDQRRIGKSWNTDTIGWDDLEGPAHDFELIVRANGTGGVDSAFLSDRAGAAHPDLHEMLIAALLLPLAEAEDGVFERWTLRLDPTAGIVRKVSARSTVRTEPVMRFTPPARIPQKTLATRAGRLRLRPLPHPQGRLRRPNPGPRRKRRRVRRLRPPCPRPMAL